MERVIILSKSMGVYLGSCLGLGFWSKLESAGQSEAVTFESESEALKFMETWDSFLSLPDDITFPHVGYNEYATMQECIKAGAEPW